MLFALKLFSASAVLSIAGASAVASLPENAQDVFNESMNWMDQYYDPSAGYLYDLGAAAALNHGTRSSVWYALGLLARNQGSDVREAEKVIINTIGGQFKDPAAQWYGTYQKYPEEPEVGISQYKPKIYDSWDPNWRGFVGTTFIMMLEEYSDLLSRDLITSIEESLYNASIGDSYRVGGVDGDNLYPAYSNPSIMRAFTSYWVGLRLNDTNMTRAGEEDAQNIIDLFDRANTLSEFNSGTYTGVSLFALLLWAKYLPADSLLSQSAPAMIQSTWEAVGELWHADLKNMAGPWDRAYGFDMKRYFSLMALWFWTLPEVGKEAAGLISRPQILSHSADFAWGPLFAILAPFHRTLIPPSVVPKLTTFSGEHIFNSSTYSPPWDLSPRNITSWLAPRITIGGESFDETVVGGPAKNPGQFNPAVVLWDTGASAGNAAGFSGDGSSTTGSSGETGFISLYATEPALDVVVSPWHLELSYPKGNSSSVFSLIVSTFKAQPTIQRWEDLVGLKVDVQGVGVDLNYTLQFAGANGGQQKPINDFDYWLFSYNVSLSGGSAADEGGAPRLMLDFELL